MERPPLQRFRGAAELPYALEVVPGAEHLLVCFPKLRIGEAKPPVGVRPVLEGLSAHRLYLGSDRDSFVGPVGTLAGFQTAVELVGQTAGLLSVPRGRVVTSGTSMGGVCALVVGFLAGVGTIVAGGAPVLVGQELRRLARAGRDATPAKRAARQILPLAETSSGADPVRFLDELVFRTAAESRDPIAVHLLVSPDDRAYKGMRKLERALRAHPTIQARLTFGVYGKHSNVGSEFYPYLRRTLEPLLPATLDVRVSA